MCSPSSLHSSRSLPTKLVISPGSSSELKRNAGRVNGLFQKSLKYKGQENNREIPFRVTGPIIDIPRSKSKCYSSFKEEPIQHLIMDGFGDQKIIPGGVFPMCDDEQSITPNPSS